MDRRGEIRRRKIFKKENTTNKFDENVFFSNDITKPNMFSDPQPKVLICDQMKEGLNVRIKSEL